MKYILHTVKASLRAIAVTATLGLAATAANAGGGDYPLDKAPDRVSSNAALQNGAKLYVNYCAACHSAVSVRYSSLRDIGLTDQQIKDNLILNGAKVGDVMTVSMTPKDAKAWFGKVPPDLSVEARARFTPTCALTTKMTPHQPVGIIWYTPMSVCPMPFGSCKAFVQRTLKSVKIQRIQAAWKKYL